MHVLFEEHAGPQRAGGVEAATTGLITALTKQGVLVTRRFTDAPQTLDFVPDCVHIHGIWSPVLARRFLHWRHLGIPCVVTVHGMLAPWALAHKRLKKWVAWHIYQKRLLSQASAMHATSEREADDLRKLGLNPLVEIIPWGIEVPEVGKPEGGDESNIEHRTSNIEHRTEDEDLPEVGKALNFKHEILNAREQELVNAPACNPKPKIADGHANEGCADFHKVRESSDRVQNSKSNIQNPKFSSKSPRTALFVGRIYPVKGLPMLVEAWAKVRPSGWKMQIVGPDEAGHLAEVEELVRKAGLEADFEFTGPLEGGSLHQAYADADIFILPSHTENFGMVVAEALAHGLPVIATQGSPWSGLLDNACGWWPEISSASIANALRAATSLDPSELRLMGTRGLVWVQNDFSWDKCARLMADLYQSLGLNKI
jgi:glycosyltransferase involved in cell wall biosynthesis